MATLHKMYLKYNNVTHHVPIDPSLGLENALIAWDENWKTYPMPTPKAIAASVNAYFKNLNQGLTFTSTSKTTRQQADFRDFGPTDFSKFYAQELPANQPMTLKLTLAGNELSIVAVSAKDLLTKLKQAVVPYPDDTSVVLLVIAGVVYPLRVSFWINADDGETNLMDFNPLDSYWDEITDESRWIIQIQVAKLDELELASGQRYPLQFEYFEITLITPDAGSNETQATIGIDYSDDQANLYSNITYEDGGFYCKTHPWFWSFENKTQYLSEGEMNDDYTYYFINRFTVTGSSGVLEIPRTTPLNQLIPKQPILRQIGADEIYYINDLFTYTVKLDFEAETIMNLSTVQALE